MRTLPVAVTRDRFPIVSSMKLQKRWVVLGIISCALFLITIDVTVLYTALPRLTHDLRASASQKLWIVNAYALVVSGLLLGMGTLGDRLGHKRLFIGGLAVFGIASLCAAFSPTPAWLIAARGLLAVGAAMMMPATLSIIRLVFSDERERAMAIGVWAAVASGGAAFGPVLGGVLLEHFWWGSVFLINVPIVLVALVLGITLIPSRPGNAQRHWDLWGSILIMVGLISLAYAIKELGKRVPSFEAAALAFIVGGVFMLCFVWHQRRSAQPMVDFAIFRHRGFMAAVASGLVASAALMGLELVLSQRLQLVLGMSPLQTSLFMLPLPLACFVSGPLTGRMLPRIGGQRMLFWGLLVSALGMGAYLVLHNAPLAAQIASLLALGGGLGATMTAASSTIMQSAPADRAGMAASIEEVAFELGAAVGVTLMGSILSAVYTRVMAVPAGIEAPAAVRDGLDEALLAAEGMAAESGTTVLTLAHAAFDQGFVAVLAASVLLLLMTAVVVRLRSPARFPHAARDTL